MIKWRSLGLRGRAWVTGALVGLVLATGVVGGLEIFRFHTLVNVVRLAAAYIAPPAVLLGLLTVLRFGNTAWRDLRYWAAQPFGGPDAFLLAAFGALLLAPRWAAVAWGTHLPDWAPFVWWLAALAVAPEAARWALAAWSGLRHRPIAASADPEADILDKVIAGAGMEALPDLAIKDTLDRQPFVDILETAVRRPRERSLVFALDGPWGSGKTTILDALAKRLEAHGAAVVRFDALSFREPERVVDHYLTELGHALRRAGGAPWLRSRLRRLGLGIAPLAGGRLNDALRNLLSLNATDSLRELVAELRRALTAQRQVVVVLIDDLDRLERDELHAALRMLRLVAALPRIAHVLAYDRAQLARVLFPEDSSGRVARDYVAKIVSIELTLSTPTPQVTFHLLGEALGPLLAIVDREDADRFVDRLRSVPRQVFVEAMPTPRDVRKVAAATALIWPKVRREVNLFDLFVLQVIHLRVPHVFAVLHAHPQWFTDQRWSSDVWRIPEEKRWLGERDAYLEQLRASGDSEDVNVARLLALIFPSLRQGPGVSTPTEADARRQRLICHPDVFPRYFQLSVPSETIAESTVEDLAERIRTQPPDVRAALVQQTIEDAVSRGSASALFDQWDIFVERLSPTSQAPSDDLIRDVIVGVARTAKTLPGDYNDPANTQRTAARAILQVIGRAETNRQVSDLIADAIRDCTSFSVSGDLVFYTTQADQGRAFPDRVLDTAKIRGEFDQAVIRRFGASAGQGNLFDLQEADLAAILYRTEQDHILRQIIHRSLVERPEALPRLLRLSVSLEPNSDDPNDVSVYSDGLDDLHRRFALGDLINIVERLPTEFWQDRHDRALVHYLRTRGPIIIAAPEQSKAASRVGVAPPASSAGAGTAD